MRLLICLLLCSLACRAADRIALTEKELTLPPYGQFTLRDGLPQMQVICMLQDSRGYIWIGTKKGLACYNGEKFISYTTKNGLANDYIHSLCEDYSGNIWINSSLGLSRFNGKSIVSFPLTEQNSFRISPAPDGKIWFISGDSKENLLFGYFENGKYYSQPDHFISPASYQQNDIAYSIGGKKVLIANNSMVWEYGNGRAQKIYTSTDTLIVIKSLKGRALFVDLQDRQNMTLYEYISGKLVTLAWVQKGRITGTSLLDETIHFTMDSSTLPLFTLSPDTFLTENLHGIQKNQFLYDRDHNLWIGSEEGVFRIYPEAFRTYKKEYLPQVWSVTEDNKGNTWFASFHFGLKQYDGYSLLSYPEWERSLKANGFYFHPSVSQKGVMYFPYNYGVLIKEGAAFSRLGTNPPYLTTWYDKERELLWAGSMKKAEIFDARHRLVRSIGQNEGLATQRYILCIQKDAKGHYWLGSTGALSRYNWETGELINYTVENARLPAEKILSICNDSRKRTWFGSSEGLLWYDCARDSVLKLECEELKESVNMVAAIDSSWLLVSQPAGIYLMDLQKYYTSGDIELHLFNSSNGYMGIEPGQDGAFTDSRGNIWMTSGSEVVRLDPRKLKLNRNSLEVRMSKCNGFSLPYSSTLFHLPANNQTAIVEFDAICFNRPKPVQFSWKQENEKEWSPWQESNYAVLTGLTNGKCQVDVRARIPGLPLPEYATASLVLQVNLALWKQAWFFPSLFGLLALLALITLVLLLKTRIRMSEANRQAKISQLQAIQSQMNPHFIFNALASLQSMILSMNMEKANEYLVKLSALIRGFLEASVSTGIPGNGENGKMEISLADELNTLGNYISFQQVIYPGRFDYVPVVDPEIDPDRQTIPPMLLQPFVENAIRHGLLPKKGKGKLEIHISQAPGNGIRVELSDDGIGMEEAGNVIRKSPFRFVSRGRELTLKRIQLMNETGYHIRINTSSSALGTKITLQINHDGK